MSVRAMSLVWRHYPQGGGELVLALALADWCDDRGRGIYPAVPAAARKARLSDRQVQRLLRHMEAAGYLTTDGETEYGTRRYRLRLDRIEALAVVYGRRGEDDETDVTPGDKMSPGDIGDANPAGDVAKNDTMSRQEPRMSPNTFTVLTSSTPLPGGGDDLAWPDQLTPATRAACEQELSHCAIEHRTAIVRELTHRLVRAHDPLRLPHIWIRTLVRAAQTGTLAQLAPAAPLTAERRDGIEADYQRRLHESRERGARQVLGRE